MPGPAEKSYSPEVVTTYVWDAIKSLPGVVDLHRTPLQSLGERVHVEWHGPVRLADHEGKTVLEIHVVIRPDARVADLTPAIRRQAADYLRSMTGIELDGVTVFVDDIVWDEPPADA